MEHSPLILASQSPRRKELLSNMGYTFDCIPADIDETPHDEEKPTDYVSRLAKEKAECVAKLRQAPVTVIGSDTIVVFEDKLLGKPENLAQCQAYLTMLSGNATSSIDGSICCSARVNQNNCSINRGRFC